MESRVRKERFKELLYLALMGDEKGRGLDLLSPVWHFFDLTPEGRGDWFPGS